MTSHVPIELCLGTDPGDHGPEISVISQAAVRLFTEHYGDSIRALILTGSLARNEGTFVSAGSNSVLIGDAEFVVVLRDDVGLPSEAVTTDLCRQVETALLQTGLTARISAAVVHNDFLRRMKPHMFAYELRTCGVAIWGEPRILEAVPQFAASEIPLEDAWWTLCNRSIEALEAIALTDTDQPQVPRDVFYRVIKLYLDIATSLLLFTGGYEPSYAKRSQRLSWLATQHIGGADIPVPLADLSREVVACTNWKLAPDDSFERQASWRWCFRALEYAGLLWRWELLRLPRAPAPTLHQHLTPPWI